MIHCGPNYGVNADRSTHSLAHKEKEEERSFLEIVGKAKETKVGQRIGRLINWGSFWGAGHFNITGIGPIKRKKVWFVSGREDAKFCC